MSKKIIKKLIEDNNVSGFLNYIHKELNERVEEEYDFIIIEHDTIDEATYGHEKMMAHHFLNRDVKDLPPEYKTDSDEDEDDDIVVKNKLTGDEEEDLEKSLDDIKSGRNEEYEQIDELSKTKLAKYTSRALNDMRNANRAIGRRDKGRYFLDDLPADVANDIQNQYHKANRRQAKNRELGIRRATKRLAKEETDQLDEINKKRDFNAELKAARDAKDWKAHARIWDERSRAEVDNDEAILRKKTKPKIKEETDQLDELSNKKLGQYVKKAVPDLARKEYYYGANAVRLNTDNEKAFLKSKRETEKRGKYISKALDKITKEEYELDEAIRKDFSGRALAAKRLSDKKKRKAKTEKNKRNLHNRDIRIDKLTTKEEYDLDESSKSGIWRREKRYLSKMGYDPKMQAYDLGSYHGNEGKPYKNPYPKGKRHDAYHHGYHTSDPMGRHHGRNEEYLDELSKKTLGSYIKHAADSRNIEGDKVSKAINLKKRVDDFTNTNDLDYETRNKINNIVYDTADENEKKARRNLRKRFQGINRAVDRLTKEEYLHEESHYVVVGGKESKYLGHHNNSTEAIRHASKAEDESGYVSQVHHIKDGIVQKTWAWKDNEQRYAPSNDWKGEKIFIKGYSDKKKVTEGKHHFIHKARMAKASGKSHFKFGNKTYKVTIKEEYINEDIYATIKNMIQHGTKEQELSFRDGKSTDIALDQAKVIYNYCKNLTDKNKEKFMNMLNGTSKSFLMAMNLAYK